jgi:hypothetical protein
MGKVQNFLPLEQVVRTETTVLQRVKQTIIQSINKTVTCYVKTKDNRARFNLKYFSRNVRKGPFIQALYALFSGHIS